nr:MAG TPA: hypothetical protein [Caudoviricetes sp.]
MERFKASKAEVIVSYVRFYAREFRAHVGEIITGVALGAFIVFLPVLAAMFI